MIIHDRAFNAWLQCKTKYLLYLKHESPRDDTEFVLWLANVQGHYESAAEDRICATVPTDRVFRGTPPYPELRTGSNPYGLVLGYEATTGELQSRLHALILTKGKSPGRQEYAPVRFVFRNKLQSSDRLRLAFDALAASADLGYVPTTGKLIHGNNYRAVTVKLTPLGQESSSPPGNYPSYGNAE